MLYPHQGKNACAAFSVGYRKAPLESDNCFSHTVPRVSAIWHEHSALQIPNLLGSQSTVRCYANAEIIHEKWRKIPGLWPGVWRPVLVFRGLFRPPAPDKASSATVTLCLGFLTLVTSAVLQTHKPTILAKVQKNGHGLLQVRYVGAFIPVPKWQHPHESLSKQKHQGSTGSLVLMDIPVEQWKFWQPIQRPNLQVVLTSIASWTKFQGERWRIWLVNIWTLPPNVRAGGILKLG